MQLLFSLFLLVTAAPSWEHRAYLATFPRSGNHWVRHLIEEATHIATSSVYIDNDPPHLSKSFPWGGYCCDHGYEGFCRYPEKNEPAVVKTHYPALEERKFDKLPYDVTIRVVRNPIRSLYSYYEYNMDLNKQPKEEMIPQNWLKEAVSTYKRFEEYWNGQPNVLTVRYEDLFEKPKEILKKILEALHIPFKEEDLDRAVKHHPPKERIKNHSAHYTANDLQYVKEELKDLMLFYGYE